ncbi:HMP-PP phosphatase [Usitatibacter rugosus]|uniref:HMP-PP phosphatase n=1 Tax=Usitatibacter rugosus TaxID=2732067 RepID=A0A6M4GUN5_9PROT|nr:HAD family hydrolase [Usitatibacter rugosus]QJR11030.1 HMP-PP phosphatase [Usitatibacter rugosus]
MRFAALAVDFDGTLAREGVVPPELLAALERVKASGRRVVLVTGRDLDELIGIFPSITLFDRVVAENGALLYRPATGEREQLGPEPGEAFVEALRARGVTPLAVGRSIVATVQPYEKEVLETIRDLGLERQVIFNKGAVMVLPSGVNKATGLAVALAELKLSPRNVVAMGDGENDHAMLEMAELGVAVSNAIPTLREAAHRVTTGSDHEGVMEVVADLLASDLDTPTRRPGRSMLLGRSVEGRDVCVPAMGSSVLIAGESRAESVGFAHRLLERIRAQGYQCCVLDTTGEHRELKDAVVLGSIESPPEARAIVEALESPEVAVVADLRALEEKARGTWLADFAARMAELRRTRCRPHRLVIDDAHDLLASGDELPEGLLSVDAIHVTTDPAGLAVDLLETVDSVIELTDEGITYRSADDETRIVLEPRSEAVSRVTPPSTVARLAASPPAAPSH